MPDGSQAQVAQPGRAALRFNEVAGALQLSIDGAPYVTIPLGGGGSSPWLDDGAGTVRLQSTSNDVVIGGVATVGTEKLRVVGDIRVDSQLQVSEVTTAPSSGTDLALGADSGNITASVSGANGYRVVNSVGDPLLSLNPTTNAVVIAAAAAAVDLVQQWATRTEINVGADGAALDVRQGGNSRLTLDTVTDTLSTGTAAQPLDAVVHGGAQYNVPTADPNAFRIRDSAGREYFNVDTQAGVETITVGNATTNPSVEFVGSGDFDLGTGTLRTDGGIDRADPGDLAIAPEQATSVTVGAAANPVSYVITVPANTANALRILDPAGNAYMTVTTTNFGQFVGFGSNVIGPRYTFAGSGAPVVVGADGSGRVEAASFGPGATSFFNRPMFVGADVQATALTLGHGAAAMTINSSDVAISAAPLSLGELGTDPAPAADVGRVYTKEVATVAELFYRDDAGNVVQMTSGGSIPGSTSVELADNTAGAYTISEGANPYLTTDTTDGAELVRWGASGATVKPRHRWFLPVSGSAFEVVHGTTGAIYIRCALTNNAENIQIGDPTGTANRATRVEIYTTSNSAAFLLQNSQTGRDILRCNDGAAKWITFGNPSDNHQLRLRGDGPLYLGTDFGDEPSIQLRERAAASDPTAVAGHGFVYVKDASGNTELYFRDEDANIVQITSRGSIATSVTLQDNTAAAYSIADTTGDSYLSVATTTGGEAIVLGNAVNSPNLTVAGGGDIALGAAGARIGVLGASPVARSAAYTVTNGAVRRDFDADTVTTAQLAQVVGTIIADFQGFGYLG